MTRPDWARWPQVAACGSSGAAVGRAARELPCESRGCGTSCGSSRDTGLGPTVPRKPRPGPCRQTARCGARRAPVAAPARPALVAAGAGGGGGGRWGLAARAPPPQPLGFSHEPLVLGDQGGVGIGLSPTTLGAQSGQRPLVALLPPRAQQRRVQALAPEQGTELAGGGAAIGLLEDAQLVLRGEPSPHGLLQDGRVWDRPSVASGRGPRGCDDGGGGGGARADDPS